MFGVENRLVVGAVFRKTYAAKTIPASILRGIRAHPGKMAGHLGPILEPTQLSLGVAQGWYGAGPLALKARFSG